MKSYEEIHVLASRICSPRTGGNLSVEWVLPRRLAIGRDSEDRHLLVMGAQGIRAESGAVQRALMEGTWSNEAGSDIEGTLLRLHSGEEFMVATTTIAVELLRRDLGARPVDEVFLEIEPFVELVIRRILLPPESLLGLVGELLVLDYLVDVIGELSHAKRVDPAAAWQGHSRKSRDFRLNRLGLEVKTTTGPSSRHRIGGLDQIEPRMLDDQALEALFLVSIGLREDVAGTSRISVVTLTESILGKLDLEAGERFLDQLRQYGPNDCAGYDHATMATWEPYARGFSTTFPPRVYDMSDQNLLVIRRRGLQQHFPFVVPEGIAFTVDLPDSVPGSHGANPRAGLRAELSRLAGQFA